MAADNKFDFDELDSEFAAFNQPETPVAPTMGAAPALDANLAQGLVASPNTSPDLKAALIKKFDLGEYSDENRRKLQEDSKLGLGDRISAALGAAGAGIMGKDATGAGMAILNARKGEKRQALEDFEKGRSGKIQEFSLDRDLTKAEREDRDDAMKQKMLADSKDPSSDRSKSAQAILVEDFGFDPAKAATLTAEQIEARIPTLKGRLDREFRDREATENRALREREFSERSKDRAESRKFREEEARLRREEMALRRDEAKSQKDLVREDKLEKEARLSDKQIAQVTEFDDALSSIDSIKRQKDEFDTGPVSSAQSKVAGFFGIDDSKKSAFKAQVQDDLARYIKSISGGAVSDQERAFLIENLPTMSDNDETFKAKLDVVEKRLRKNRENFLGNAEKAGKRVDKFKEAPGSSSYPKQVRKGNQVATVNSAEEEAEAKGEGFQ